MKSSSAKTSRLVKVEGSEGPSKRASAMPGMLNALLFEHPAPLHPSVIRKGGKSPHSSPDQRAQRSPRMSPRMNPGFDQSPGLAPLSPTHRHTLGPVGRGSFNKLTNLPKDTNKSPKAKRGSSPTSTAPGSPTGSRTSFVLDEDGEEKSTKKFIDVETIAKALQELGLYPTLKEVNTMHQILSNSVDRKYRNGKADFDEFLLMVELLTLGQFDDVAKIQLHKIFRKFGIDPPMEDEESNNRHEEKVLTQHGLGDLMDALGHHDDESELMVSIQSDAGAM